MIGDRRRFDKEGNFIAKEPDTMAEQSPNQPENRELSPQAEALVNAYDNILELQAEASSLEIKIGQAMDMVRIAYDSLTEEEQNRIREKLKDVQDPANVRGIGFIPQKPSSELEKRHGPIGFNPLNKKE